MGYLSGQSVHFGLCLDQACNSNSCLQAEVPGIPEVLKVPVQDLEACQTLLASGDWANPVRHEGMVATDAQFNRVKVRAI